MVETKLVVFSVVFAAVVAIVVGVLFTNLTIASAPESDRVEKELALIWKECAYKDIEAQCTSAMSDGPGWRGYMEDNYLKHKEYADQKFYEKLHDGGA